jgi:hypothetical protein
MRQISKTPTISITTCLFSWVQTEKKFSFWSTPAVLGSGFPLKSALLAILIDLIPALTNFQTITTLQDPLKRELTTHLDGLQAYALLTLFNLVRPPWM